MQENQYDEVIQKFDIFRKQFDFVRVVDPNRKKVLSKTDPTDVSDDTPLEIDCFNFWCKDNFCDNCISVRAFNNNRMYVKFEYTEIGIYMILAIPFEMKDKRVVVELLAEATESLLLEYGSSDVSLEIKNLVDNLNRLSLKDSLTGVYNRRYVKEKLPIEKSNILLSNRNFSLIMADIDHFKIVNDTYGHLAGDEVLKVFAETLSTVLKRKSDWIARYGGEEFLICLSGADKEKAVEIAENMRKAVAEKSIFYGGDEISITASFGVVTINNFFEYEVEQIIDMADEKLYSAKKNGRNRVES